MKGSQIKYLPKLEADALGFNYGSLLITEVDVHNAYQTERGKEIKMKKEGSSRSYHTPKTPNQQAQPPSAQNLQKQRTHFFSNSPSQDQQIQTIEKHSFRQLELISFSPPSHSFYDTYPVKPGIHFLKSLVETDYPLTGLSGVNFPLTMGLFQEKFVMRTEGPKGEVVVKTQFRNSEFIDQAVSEQERLKGTSSQPFLVLKQEDFPSYCVQKQALPFTFDLKEEVLSKLEVNQCVQQYVPSATQKAAFYRVAFHNKDCVSSKQSQIFYVSNSHKVSSEKLNPYLRIIFGSEDNDSKKHKLTLSQRSFVCYDNHGSFSVVEQKSLIGLEPLGEACEKLTGFALKAFKVKMKLLVADFVKDCHGAFWFMGVKHFEVTDLAPFVKEIYSYCQEVIHCQLCRMPYRKEEIKRSINYKMLLGLKDHFNKRGIFILEKINPNLRNDSSIYHNKWKTQTCRVCDICYMLLIAESDLFQAQKQFAGALNIPISQEEEGLSSIETSPMRHNHQAFKGQKKFSSAQFKEKLIQWRILIYINCLYEISDALAKQIKKNKNQCYLELRILGYMTKFPVDISTLELVDSSSNLQQVQHSKLVINKLRVHYFFSEDLKINQFLQNANIEVRISQKPRKNGEGLSSIIASGNINPFTHFKGSDFSHVLNESFSLHLFQDDFNSFFLNGTIGLKKDYNIKAKDLELYLWEGVYIPNDNYFNCDPFPVEWLEVVDKDTLVQGKIAKFQEPPTLNKESFYTIINPVIPESQLKIRSSSSARYKGIQSCYKDYFSGYNNEDSRYDIQNRERDRESQSMLLHYQSAKTVSAFRMDNNSSRSNTSDFDRPPTSRFAQKNPYEKESRNLVLPTLLNEQKSQDKIQSLQNKCYQSQSKYINKILDDQFMQLKQPESHREARESDFARAPIWQDYQFKADYFNNGKKIIKKAKKKSKSRKQYGSISQRQIYQAYFGNPSSKNEQQKESLKKILESIVRKKSSKK